MKRQKPSKELSVARQDLIQSHHMLHDTIKELWVNYVDPAGNKPSSPNSHMTLRRQWNRYFGISSIKEIAGDIERCLLYALANARAAKTIRQGVEQKRLRPEIRESTYQIFKVVGGL